MGAAAGGMRRSPTSRWREVEVAERKWRCGCTIFSRARWSVLSVCGAAHWVCSVELASSNVLMYSCLSSVVFDRGSYWKRAQRVECVSCISNGFFLGIRVCGFHFEASHLHQCTHHLPCSYTHTHSLSLSLSLFLSLSLSLSHRDVSVAGTPACAFRKEAEA